MMTRGLLSLVLLVAAPALALLQQPLPGYMAASTSHTPAANTMYCVITPAWLTMTGSKFAGDIATAVASTTSGFALYPNSDGGTALARVSGSSAAVGPISGTGFTIPLTAGTLYRICACTSSTSVRYTAGIDFISPAFQRSTDLLNAVTTNAGTAANACDGTNGSSGNGDPPTTTGAITAASGIAIPIVLVEE